MKQTTHDSLKTSSWVTGIWDWIMTFLGRAAEAVLFITMVINAYQLIPNAPALPATFSTIVFIAQFIALDVGGMGLNKLAQGLNLPKDSYQRRVARTLIAITLVTVSFAGLEHAVQIPPTAITVVEVALVIWRSVMIVLYAQAIHGLKHQATVQQQEVAQIQTDRDVLVQSLHTQVQRLEGALHRAMEQQAATAQEVQRSLAEVQQGVQRQIAATVQSEVQPLLALVQSTTTHPAPGVQSTHPTTHPATHAVTRQGVQSTHATTPPGGQAERAQRWITTQLASGNAPTLRQIEEACECSRRTAIDARRAVTGEQALEESAPRLRVVNS